MVFPVNYPLLQRPLKLICIMSVTSDNADKRNLDKRKKYKCLIFLAKTICIIIITVYINS